MPRSYREFRPELVRKKGDEVDGEGTRDGEETGERGRDARR